MKKSFVVTTVLFGMLTVTGCYRTLYRGPSIGFPVSPNRPAQGEAVVGHFQKRVWNHYFLYGMAPTSIPAIQELIQDEVPPGHEVRNLTIRHERSFVNGLIAELTSGIYGPMTTTISGDVVKVSGRVQ